MPAREKQRPSVDSMSGRVATIYPENALVGRADLDIIFPEQAATLHALFRERVRRTPDKVAYREHDGTSWRDYNWRAIASEVKCWRAALEKEALHAGDRVALQLNNCRHWVIFEQAALSLGLVVVPLYMGDRPDNCNYIIDHCGAKLLLLRTLREWRELEQADGDTRQLQRVVVLEGDIEQDGLVHALAAWLPEAGDDYDEAACAAGDLASIVYTSGTTGRPKGVMLSHKNIIYNAYSCVRSVAVSPRDSLLSFLPLSHTLERTVGYYVPMLAGAEVAFNRSIPQLREDLQDIRPTGIITVPRIFERAHTKIKASLEEGPAWQRRLLELTVSVGWARFQYRQGRGPWGLSFLLWPLLDMLVAKDVRAGFGGRLRIAISGGAPLPPPVGRFFNALGINVLQGYGLTESSPTITTNTIRHNRPETIGLPMLDIEVRIGDNDELMARGPNIMLGYWRNQEATRAVLTEDGWLHSGDQAKIDDGYVIITGRLKDILVLANGEKVPPADMESVIAEDPLFDQSMVIGEQMPYLSVLVVLNKDLWHGLAKQWNIDAGDEASLSSKEVETHLLERIQQRTREFPGYATIRRCGALLEPWTIEGGLLTPTLKIKRAKVLERYRDQVAYLYEGHEIYRNN